MHTVNTDPGIPVGQACALHGGAAGAPSVCVMAETFHWRMPSKPELIEKIVMSLKDRAEAWGLCTPDRMTGLVISLTEAITNAVVHGNLEISSDIRERTDGEYGRQLATRCADPKYSEREVQIDVRWDGRACLWTIADHGNGFDVDRILARLDTDEPSELASGRGILLMRAFMDDVKWSSGGREIRLAMNRDQQPEHADDEQKMKVRQAVTAKVGNQSVDAVATSVSTKGIELLAKGLNNAKRLMIEIDVDGKKTLVPAEVRHVTALAADWVQIDCRFASDTIHENTEDAAAQRAAIERILQGTHRAADEGHERRTSERFQYTEVLRIERKDGTAFHGVARDLSRGGMAFIGNFELDRGELLTLTLEPETAMPVKVTCEVKRVQHLMGAFRDYGVRFVTPSQTN